MRIAFSSTFRIAAGLLLAVLLSCVGYQVLRRRNSGAPEALLTRADEPTLVEAHQLGGGLGYLKIAMFPGMVGVEVANEISGALEKLGAVDRLIIDLRGNTGGGIGALRVMSILTPGRIPVGFALDRRRASASLESEKRQFPRFSRIPSSKRALWPLALQFAPDCTLATPKISVWQF
jgi:carboxyl-terminal processing protease